MALITPSLIKNLFTSFNLNFEQGKSEAMPQYTKVASVIKSTTASNTYGWLGKFPGLKRWVGDRTLQSMKAHAYTITNEDYEATIEVERNDIEDDNLGIYAPIFKEAGSSAAIHPDEEVYALLKDGFIKPCYDNQFFFDTDHPVNAKQDGSGADVSVSNVEVDVAYVGEPWYVLDTSKAIKPIIFQERKKPKLISMTSETDEAVFMSKKYRYGVDCRDAVGFGFWQMAFGNKRDLNADNLWDCIQKMRSFTADGGRKLGIKPTVLVVPPSLEKLATRLLERELDSNSTNELKGRVELVVADYL